MSMSMSGGPSRSGDRKRSNSRPSDTASALVMPERVADRRVGGAAPALAEDVRPAAERHDVPHHQEVAGEPQRLDDRQLVVDLGPGLAVAVAVAPGVGAAPGPVAVGGALLGQPAQVGHLVEPVGAGERRQLGRHQRQVEGAGPPQLGGAGSTAPGQRAKRRACSSPERRWAVPAAGSQPVEVVEAAPGPHRGQRGGQAAPVGRGVVDVVGGHQVEPRPHRQGGEGVVAGRVERVAVVAQLDRHVVRPRTCRPAAPARGPRPPDPRRSSARGTAPLRQPVSTSQWPPCAAAQSTPE